MADSVAARGLVREDLEGHCMFIEGGVGLIGGASGAAMLFGLDAKLLAMTAATLTPVGNLLLPNDSAVRLLRSAKDVIMAAGLTQGCRPVLARRFPWAGCSRFSQEWQLTTLGALPALGSLSGCIVSGFWFVHSATYEDLRKLNANKE